MESLSHEHAIGFPVSSVTYAGEDLAKGSSSSADVENLFTESNSYGSFDSKQNNKDSAIHWMSKLSKRADSYAQGIREHVTLGPKLSETVKGKLRLGARIVQAGGLGRVFRQSFSVEKGEKLVKAFQCYLSTTAGPIAGMLFISTEKIAFRSDRSLALTSPKGDMAQVPYKVLVPLGRIKGAIPSENIDKPEQKYIQIVTVDDFEFWFMGFVCYDKSFKYLQQAISDLQ